MADEHSILAGGAGGVVGLSGEEKTAATDLARLFVTNLGLELRANGRRVVENGDAISDLGSRLSRDNPIRRRAGLVGLDIELAKSIETMLLTVMTLEDARSMIREQANAISMSIGVRK